MSNHEKNLAGKVAVVTGASKGIGAEIARQFAAAGASVVVNYASSKQDADRVVSQIVQKQGKAIAIQADMSKPTDVRRLFEESKQAFGPLDVLVNNAGVYVFAPLEEVTPEFFHKQFDLNVLGLILASQEAARQFGDRGGNIINISSVASTATPPTASVYSATKAAVDAVTKTLAKELGSRKIRVNSINPGMIETEGTKSGGITSSDFEKQMIQQTPLGRIGQPNDIAPVALFLASAGSSWITGESLFVAGGYR